MEVKFNNITRNRLMINKFGNLLIKHKKLGFIAFVKKCFLYIVEIEDSVVLEKNLDAALVSSKVKLEIAIKEISEEDFKNILLGKPEDFLEKIHIGMSSVEERLGRKQICLGAFYRGELCGYSWISTNFINMMGGNRDSLTSSEIGYIFDSFVLTEFRRRGIASAINSAQINLMRKKFCKTAIAIISRSNKANRIVMRNVGFTEKGGILVITLLRKYKLIATMRVKGDIINIIESLRGAKF